MAFSFGPFWSAAAGPWEFWANPAWLNMVTHKRRIFPKRVVIFIIFCFISINNYKSHYRTSCAYYFLHDGIGCSLCCMVSAGNAAGSARLADRIFPYKEFL